MNRLNCVFLLALVLALGACQDQKTNTQNAAPDIEQEQQDLSASAESELISPEEDADAKETANPESDSVSAETLIENMGFSSAQTEEVETITTPYCLNIPSDQPTVSLDQACNRISGRLASVSKSDCQAAALKYTQCNSVDGFPILFTEFPPVEDRQPQGRILVIGGMHGDELTSVSIVFRWINKLNKYHSGLFHWHMVPMMNPDGVLPRRAQRPNKNGVDLNRNLPSDDWQQNALKYWHEKQNEDPRKYPGEEPASEPETRWLIDEIADFKPDAIISVHAPYGVVDFDALSLNTAPKSLGKLHLNLLGTYPGSLGNYAGINLDIPVITLELPHAWEMPSEHETSKIWEDIVTWLRKNVNQDNEVLAD